MARRFTRRKPRVAWLPTFGDTYIGESGGVQQANGIRFQVAINSGIEVDAVGITWDGSESSAASQGLGLSYFTLNDFVNGQSYRLRRIVGKFFCSLSQGPNITNGLIAADVALGFILCRSDSNGALQTDFNEVNPLYQDSMDDPWIWRRRWVLGNPGYGLDTQWGGFPRTNVDYGSVADGPHIDQKTARVIGPDERLVAVVATRALATIGENAPAPDGVLNAFLDYRILATMRSTQGNRRNASR